MAANRFLNDEVDVFSATVIITMYEILIPTKNINVIQSEP